MACKALIEFNVFRLPTPDGASDVDKQSVAAFGEFWESEAPRVGDIVRFFVFGCCLLVAW